MISKDQFLELKHLKSLGVPTTTIAKKIGISVPNANKWLRLDEEAFENYLRNNTPYLEQYRAFIISILKSAHRRRQPISCIGSRTSSRTSTARKRPSSDT